MMSSTLPTTNSSLAAAQAAENDNAPDCTMLRRADAPSHWFSAPLSRIVINPTMTIVNPGASPLRCSEEGAVSPLRVNAAYYAGELPTTIPALWVWQPGDLASLRAAEIAGPAADLAAARDAHYARAASEGMSIRLTLEPGKTWGEVSVPLTADLDETPWLVVDASEADEQWCVKVKSDTDASDILVVANVGGPASKIIDLRAATGWQGRRSFSVKLFALGKPGASVRFDSVRCTGLRRPPTGLERSASEWYPHKMVTSVSGDRGMEITATTMLSDADTISQKLNVGRAGCGKLTLMGQFSGQASWHAQRQQLILQGKGFSVAVSVSRPAKWLGTFSDWCFGRPAQTGARNSVWALEIEDVIDGDEIVVSAAFAPHTSVDPGSEVQPEFGQALSPERFDAVLRRQERDWNERLALVPRPKDFTLHLTESLDVAPDDIRQCYYEAWVFLYMNLLPAMPENGYPFPQLAAGKPSLWDEGHPACRATAQWESFIGMQFLSLVDAETAWKCYEGFLTLVDSEGTIAGEGLPARHCRTAWALYTQTGDLARLGAVYPALKRFLQWKFEFPHWIHKRLPDPNEKSSEFVTSAILDAQYAAMIAETLGLPDEVVLWRRHISDYGKKFQRWFWDNDGRPYLSIDLATGERRNRESVLLLESLGLPPGILDPTHRDALLSLYSELTKPELPFMQAGFTKEPTRRMLRQGLWQYGTADQVAKLLESEMRSITRAGEFAEEYVQSDPPICSGVSPSLFGACMLISAALWHGGVIPDEGLPVLARVPHAVGVSNLCVRGEPISVRYEEGDRVVLEGDGLEHLRIPEGFSVAPQNGHGQCWHGTLPVGQQLALKPLAG